MNKSIKEVRYKIRISYDGLNYSGWQFQPDKTTIQGEIEKALYKLGGNKIVKIEGSGRTDAGVHARYQVAHFDLKKPIHITSYKASLNSILNNDIRIHSLKKIKSNFHSRYDIKSKEYKYFIYNSKIIPAYLRNYSYHEHRKLNIEKMSEAAKLLVGKHDFSVFSVNPGYNVEDTTREIFKIDIKKRNSNIIISVIGNGFLYKMVRSIVGFLIDVGLGNFEPSSVKKIFIKEKRDKDVKTAPARGLFLWKVNY